MEGHTFKRICDLFRQHRIRAWYNSQEKWTKISKGPKTANHGLLMGEITEKINHIMKTLIITQEERIQVKEQTRQAEEEWLEDFINQTMREKKPIELTPIKDGLVNLTEIAIPEEIEMILSWGKKEILGSTLKIAPQLLTELDTVIDRKIPIGLQEHTKKLCGKTMGEKTHLNHIQQYMNFMQWRVQDFMDKKDLWYKATKARKWP